MGLQDQKDDGEFDSHWTPWSKPNNRSAFLPFKSLSTVKGLTSPDPYKLQKAHVVITSYNTVTFEHASFAPNAKDESSKSKSKKSAKSSGAEANSDLTHLMVFRRNWMQEQLWVRQGMHYSVWSGSTLSLVNGCLMMYPHTCTEHLCTDKAHNIKNWKMKSASQVQMVSHWNAYVSLKIWWGPLTDQLPIHWIFKLINEYGSFCML